MTTKSTKAMDAQEIVALIEERIKSVLHAEQAAYDAVQTQMRDEPKRIAYQASLAERVMLEGLLAEIKGEKYVFHDTYTGAI